MAILRWYPIRETASLESRMNSLFEDISRIEETDSKKVGQYRLRSARRCL